MSEKIIANNLDEIVSKNSLISDEIREKSLLIRTNWNRMQISSSSQLALQILKTYGLIQVPIDNPFWSGAIFVKKDKKIPVINTALPRANQYFTAWHEIYHLIYDKISFSHIIDEKTILEERKAEYFASLMLLGNLFPYYMDLPKETDFLAKIFYCMDAFSAPYKAVLIELYENAVQNQNKTLIAEIKDNFDNTFSDLPRRFRELGLDDNLVKPSYVVNVCPLQAKINDKVNQDPELNYNHDNAKFLDNIVREINLLIARENA